MLDLEQRLNLSVENERLLSMYRIFLVIEMLQKNSKGKLLLDIEKAIFFDYVISSHHITRRVLSYFKPEQSLDDRYYVADVYEKTISPVNVFDDTQVRANIAALASSGTINIVFDDAVPYVTTSRDLEAIESDVVNFWRDSLKMLRALTSKSITQLYRSLLEAPHA